MGINLLNSFIFFFRTWLPLHAVVYFASEAQTGRVGPGLERAGPGFHKALGGGVHAVGLVAWLGSCVGHLAQI